MPYPFLPSDEEGIPDGVFLSRLLTNSGIGTGGFEPPTPSVSRKCSPTELRACIFKSNQVFLLPTNFPE